MKNILIVSDFSEASLNAARYGIALAMHFNAKLFLFHAYYAPVPVPESYLFYTAEHVGEEAMKLLKKDADSLSKYESVKIAISVAEGNATNAILSEAKRVNADLIIAGMKESIKQLRQVFGSTITSLARNSTIPLLIVPEDAVFQSPKKIALACDTASVPAAGTVTLLKEIGLCFNSAISMLWVVDKKNCDTNKLREKYFGIISMLKDMKLVFEAIQGEDVPERLEDFAEKNKVDIMAVVPHSHHLWETLFMKTVTKRMIFHTKIPLLLLPQNVIVTVPEKN